MARFEDTPNLFGCGAGSGTTAEITCGLCGEVYNGGIDPDRDGSEGESVIYTVFGDLPVGNCCFEGVERAVLSRMRDILPWFTRIVKARREGVIFDEGMLDDLRKALGEGLVPSGAGTVH